jgi:imidazolonepropionase-like amidohydrolase
MSVFTSCLGKTACRDDGQRCLACHRSLAEIERTRALIDALADFALQQDYDNVAEFAAHVADKLVRKVAYRRNKAAS